MKGGKRKPPPVFRRGFLFLQGQLMSSVKNGGFVAEKFTIPT